MDLAVWIKRFWFDLKTALFQIKLFQLKKIQIDAGELLADSCSLVDFMSVLYGDSTMTRPKQRVESRLESRRIRNSDSSRDSSPNDMSRVDGPAIW